MSLTTDGLAVGAAFAIAVGSFVQVRQAYTDLNEKTPARDSVVPLFLAAIGIGLLVASPSSAAFASRLISNLGSLAAPAELTPNRPPR
jgi:hypothetical protein